MTEFNHVTLLWETVAINTLRNTEKKTQGLKKFKIFLNAKMLDINPLAPEFF